MTACVPVFAILAGILFARLDFIRLRKEIQAGLQRLEDKMEAGLTEIDACIGRTEAQLGRIDDHVIQLNAVTGKLNGRLEAIERRQR